MASKCCICYRESGTDGVTLFPYPSPDTNMYQRFLLTCFPFIDNITNETTPQICSIHFEKMYIKAHGLAGNAKPTLYMEEDRKPPPEILQELTKVTIKTEDSNESSMDMEVAESSKSIQEHFNSEEIQQEETMDDDCKMVENNMQVFDITYAEDESSEDERLSCARCKEMEKKVTDMKMKCKNELQMKAMLKIENIRLKKKIQTLETQVEFGKTQFKKKVQLSEVISATPNLSDYVRALCQILLLTCAAYTMKQKQILQLLFFKSAAIYKFLMENLKFQLPSPSFLYKWLQFRSIKPGIDHDLFARIKLRMQQMSLDSGDIVIVLDQMKVTPDLTYDADRDEIDGFFDIGNGLSRDKTLARHVTCFMVRGIRENWQQLIGFVATNVEKSEVVLQHRLLGYLKMCKQINLRVRAVICDQSTTNRRMYKALGVTPIHPYFEYEGEKVFCLYDPQHLMVSLRNCLMKYRLKIEDQSGFVNFEIFRHLYQQIQQETPEGMRLTRSHIFPNFIERTNPQFAIELLSENTSNEISDLVSSSKIPPNLRNDARSTIFFTKWIGHIYGCLDSEVPSTLVLRRKGETRKFLRNIGADFLQKLKFQLPRSNIRIHCINGLRQNVKGVLDLADDLFTDNLYSHLCTNRLTQAPVEQILKNMKSVKPHPSVTEFCKMFSRICSVMFVFDSETSIDSKEFGDLDWKTVFSFEESCDEEGYSCSNIEQFVYVDNKDSKKRKLCKSVDEVPGLTFSESTVRFLVSHCFYKFQEIIQCENCQKECIKSTDESSRDENNALSQWYIIAKDHESQDLVSVVDPMFSLTDNFYDLCYRQIQLFDKLFNKTICSSQIRKDILISLCKREKQWYDNKHGCFRHRLKLLNIFLTILIRVNCTWISQHFQK